MSDLRKRVSALYQEKWGISDMWLADAAIALVLEEAAPVVAGMYSTKPYETDWQVVRDMALHDEAAAIRALGEKA